MHFYYFQIVDLLICIQSPFVFDNFYELNEFQIQNAEKRREDILYKLQILPEDWEIRGRIIQNIRRSCVYELENEYHRYFFWNIHTDKKYIVLAHKKNNFKDFDLYIQRESIQELLKEFHFPPLMSMEQVLLQYDTFQLHASVIDWNGNGILFTAPSGIGKSTQADLWRIHEKATVINGDKGMIRRKGNSFWVYGSPYAGTSKIYTNFSVPIRAIVVLSQALENHIEQLDEISAFVKIYRESTVSSWDAEYVSKFTNLLVDLIHEIPIFHLSCRPDVDAVNLLKETLLKNLRSDKII